MTKYVPCSENVNMRIAVGVWSIGHYVPDAASITVAGNDQITAHDCADMIDEIHNAQVCN
jgi:hypothetical protein